MKRLWTWIRESEAIERNTGVLILCAGLFWLPISNAVGQIPFYLLSVWGLVSLFRGKKTESFAKVWRSPLPWMVFAYGLMIVLSVIWSVDPGATTKKFSRLALFPMVIAIPLAVLQTKNPVRAMRQALLCFLAGVCVLAVTDAIGFPYEIFVTPEVIHKCGVSHGPRTEQCTDACVTAPLLARFYHAGNMRDTQYYMCAVLILLVTTTWSRAFPPLRTWPIWFASFGGVLIHSKRGAWGATGVAALLWLLLRRKGWMLLLSATLIAGVSRIPAVQERFDDIWGELRPEDTGRAILWGEVAPRILAQHPMGMGYRTTSYEHLREALPNIYTMEDGLDHLHNAWLQTRLELGWQGLITYVGWMTSLLLVGVAALVRDWRGERTRIVAAASLATCGLMLNGIVEYNIGDSEILMLYLALTGLLTVPFSALKRPDVVDEA